MQKAFKLITAALLMSSADFAKGKSDGIADIFNEIIAYEPAPAAEQPALKPVVKPPAKGENLFAVESVQNESDTDATIEPDRAGEFAEDQVAVKPMGNVSSENVVALPASHEGVARQRSESVADILTQLTACEPAGIAQPLAVKKIQSVESMVKIAPENLAARLYPRTRLERDHRMAEIDGLKAVDAAWSTEMVFRSYALGKDACEKMEIDQVTRATDVSGIFPEVDFPKGSSAVYQPTVQALFVHNTRENLAVLESVLGSMGLAGFSTATDQVEIEAKFVEVSQGTLEELGFQWNFANNVSLGGDVVANDQPGGLFSEALRGSPTASNPSLPFSRTIDLPGGAGQASATGDWSSFRFADTFNTDPSSITLESRGSNPVDILISALDQSSGTDVLSAPRVTTRSGREATIRVGELHSYPEVFEGDSSEGTILHVSYRDFEEKLLGVELTVTPMVDENQISLRLNPKITELAGWQKFQMAPADSIYNHRQFSTSATFKHDPIIGQLPIFKKREIQTEVTIADGSTIVMGGLINEKNEAFKDKVPVLGSLPLIGRLFRNEGERVVKRNLLMFVTAKKVEPSGRINTTRSFE